MTLPKPKSTGSANTNKTMKHNDWKHRANNAIARALGVLKALPTMRGSQWAAENFYLSAESSYTEGKWQAYPYQNFILDVFCHDDVEEVSLKKAARTGYTKMLMATLAFFTCYRRRNQAIWQPTDSDAQEFVETEYNPMLRDVKPIKDIFPALEKKHQHNTNSYKKFLGCVAYIKGGSSARNYRRISVDVAILDEVDGFDKDINQEGSPSKLAKKRTEGATFPKLIRGSTPKLKYLSEIDAAIQEADAVFSYNVPCPHCQALQVLKFGTKTTNYGLKWSNKDHTTAAYLCQYCAAFFTQADYLKAWHKGRWQDQAGNWYDDTTGQLKNPQGEPIRLTKHIGIDNLWTIYSPQSTWANIVKEYRAAVAKAKHGDKSDLKTFTNTTLGDVWEDDVEKTEAADLKIRAEDFPLRIAQRGTLIVKAGVDVQKDRFELFVWGFGRGEEMWTLDYQVIPANPAIQSEWEKLDKYLLHKYPHAAGTAIRIESVGIDSGGHWTHQCYNYVRHRRSVQGWSINAVHPPKVMATKGASTPGLTISGRASLQDVNNNGKLIKLGVKLYTIGTDTAKDLFHARLQVTQHGPGFVHLSKYLPDNVFEHLTNEVRVMKQTKKGTVSAWVLKREGLRNEGLDCTVMTLFCAHKAALHKKTNAEWSFIESIVQPDQHDIFALNTPDPVSSIAMPPPTAAEKPAKQPLYVPT